MKVFLCILLSAIALSSAAEAEKKEEVAAASTTERPKTFRRLIPADVLRDFPGMCFASTRCSTIEPGKSWELAPFCGRSTCVTAEGENAGRLLELVEDCGPLPKPNPKCKLSEKTNKTAAFPDCCPVFDCEPGVKLEFPDITPPAPVVAPAAVAKPAAEAKPKA